MKRIVIIGGGFGGLYAAKTLAKTEASITLVDRRNYHLFQPLLYQVATAALNPSDIAAPIRAVLRKQKNAGVIMGDVRSIPIAASSRWPMASWPTTSSSSPPAQRIRTSTIPNGRRTRPA